MNKLLRCWSGFVVALGVSLAGCDAPPETEDQALAQTFDGNSYAGKQSPPVVRLLEAATEGLFCLSESDYPWEVVYWTRPEGALSAEAIAALTGHAGEVVEERRLEDFFRAATTLHEGHTEEDLVTVRRYRQLEKLLRAKLSFIRVYRFGTIQIHSYVVGITRSGSWAGIATIQIET